MHDHKMDQKLPGEGVTMWAATLNTMKSIKRSCHLKASVHHVVAGYGGDDNVQHEHANDVQQDGRYEQRDDHGHEQISTGLCHDALCELCTIFSLADVLHPLCLS